MYEKTPVRKTILLELDVLVTEENEDYLEAEITHPRLSGALYLTVNSRKELEEEFVKIDLTGADAEPVARPYVAPPTFASSFTSSGTPTSSIPKPILSHQLPVPSSANAVESLIKNTFNITSGLMELRMKLKKR